ncbi:MAG: SDR family oxidoreductase, partial [Pseudomonadota bacterium]
MASDSRTVIITGAGRGIGRACARRFAKNGDKIVLVDINDDDGRSAEEEITGNGGDAVFIHADVAQRLHVHNIMARTLDAYGRVDILINNAAVRGQSQFLEVTEEEYDRVLTTNLKGPFFMAQAAAKQMVEQLDGEEDARLALGQRGYTLINISSVLAVTATPGQTPYSISK